MRHSQPEKTYEVAQACLGMKERDRLSEAEIAARIADHATFILGWGCRAASVKHIGNLIRAMRCLHPMIRDAWKAGDSRATTTFLFRLAAKTHAEQLQLWGAAGGS